MKMKMTLPPKMASTAQTNKGKILNYAHAPEKLSEQFWPLIIILSIFGPYRITLVKDRRLDGERGRSTTEKKFAASQLSWRQPLSAYPFFLLVWIAFTCIIAIFNQGLNIEFPIDLASMRGSNSSWNSIIEPPISMESNRALEVFLGISRFAECVTVFVNTPLLVKWMSELEIFCNAFNRYFVRVNIILDLDMRRFRNILLLIGFVLPGTLWMGGSLWGVLPQTRLNPKYGPLGYFWFVSIQFLNVCSLLLEDIKSVMMLEVLRRIYKKGRHAIGMDAKCPSLSQKNIRNWQDLLIMMRRQVELTGQCIKTHLILSTCEAILGIAVGVLLILRDLQSEIDTGNVAWKVICAFYVTFVVSRLYFKVHIAENIYSEENGLIEDLINMESSLKDGPTDLLYELRYLQEKLRGKPAVVNIGNYGNLDKKMLVQVAIQSTTVLIAMAQFQSM